MAAHMHLKILLPFRVFADELQVTRLVVDTNRGSYGILPHRLDCTAALIPGILQYETEGNKISYIAVEEGILVKTGYTVLVSVRNAIGNAPLGELRSSVVKHLREVQEQNTNTRAVMAKLESSFIRSVQKLWKE